MKPSPRKALVRVALLVAAALVLGIPTWSLIKSLARREALAREHSADLAKRLAARAKLFEQFTTKSSALQEQQVVALASVAASRRRLVAAAGPGCENKSPRYQLGVGILQVASVPANRGADTTQFAVTQQARLFMLLKARNVPTWGSHLSHYVGKANESIYRVVFNNIAPDAGAQMCRWLKCEKWTGGCAFIDEKGETQVPKTPASDNRKLFDLSPEYAPTEDLYEAWRVSRLDG
jgi:hypothetical protein